MGRAKWKDGRRTGFKLISATGCSGLWGESRYGYFFCLERRKEKNVLDLKDEFEVSELKLYYIYALLMFVMVFLKAFFSFPCGHLLCFSLGLAKYSTITHSLALQPYLYWF